MTIHPQLLQFAGSLIAILILAWLVKKLGMGKSPTLESDEQAIAAANEVSDGFDPLDIGRDKFGRGAVLMDIDGRIMVLRQHGVHFAGRILTEGAAASLEGETVHIVSAEQRFGEVNLTLDNAPPWVEAINRLNKNSNA